MLNKKSSHTIILSAIILIALRLLFPVGCTLGRTHSWVFIFNPFVSATNFQIDYGLTILHIALVILTSAGLIFSLSSSWHKITNARESLARSARKRTTKRALLVLLVTLTSGATIFGVYYLNEHLKKERYLIYATGTNEKALLNSTWKMSAREIERANNVELEPSLTDNSFLINLLVTSAVIEMPDVVEDTSRLTSFQHPVRFWGLRGNAVYWLFDDMLYRYTVEFPGVRTFDVRELFVPALTNRYGEPDTTSANQFRWATETQSVWLNFHSKEDNYHYQEISIYAKYEPMLKAIKTILLKEQSIYF